MNSAFISIQHSAFSIALIQIEVPGRPRDRFLIGLLERFLEPLGQGVAAVLLGVHRLLKECSAPRGFVGKNPLSVRELRPISAHRLDMAHDSASGSCRSRASTDSMGMPSRIRTSESYRSLARLVDAIAVPDHLTATGVPSGSAAVTSAENAPPAAVELLAKAGLKLAERRVQAAAWLHATSTPPLK